MAKKSNWFVVATEGATTDGRTINRSWIEQMAKNYDPANKLGARINLEHIQFRFFDKSEAHSKCYGDVLALKTEQREDGKLQLLAQIDPTDELVALNKDRQKIYTSIECDPNFADSGEAYLVGLAVTDNPASLGTEMLKFASGCQHSPFASRKQKADNVFSEAVETQLEFNDVETETEQPSIFAKVKALLSRKSKTDDQRFSELEQALAFLCEHCNAQDEKLVQLSQDYQALQAEFTAQASQLSQTQATFDELAKQPSADYSERPKVSGESNDNGRFF